MFELDICSRYTNTHFSRLAITHTKIKVFHSRAASHVLLKQLFKQEKNPPSSEIWKNLLMALSLALPCKKDINVHFIQCRAVESSVGGRQENTHTKKKLGMKIVIIKLEKKRLKASLLQENEFFFPSALHNSICAFALPLPCCSCRKEPFLIRRRKGY